MRRAVLLVLLSPGWDKKLMTSAVYVYAPLYETTEGLKDAIKRRHLLFYDEGPGATVSVERNLNILSIRIDGKIDASSGNDMITQELIPMVMDTGAREDSAITIRCMFVTLFRSTQLIVIGITCWLIQFIRPAMVFPILWALLPRHPRSCGW